MCISIRGAGGWIGLASNDQYVMQLIEVLTPLDHGIDFDQKDERQYDRHRADEGSRAHGNFEVLIF